MSTTTFTVFDWVEGTVRLPVAIDKVVVPFVAAVLQVAPEHAVERLEIGISVAPTKSCTPLTTSGKAAPVDLIARASEVTRTSEPESAASRTRFEISKF